MMFTVALILALSITFLYWLSTPARPVLFKETPLDPFRDLLLEAVAKSHFGFCVLNDQQHVISINDHFCAHFDINCKTVLGRPIAAIASIPLLEKLVAAENSETKTFHLEEDNTQPISLTVAAKNGSVILLTQLTATENDESESHDSATALNIQRYLSEVEHARKKIELQSRELATQTHELAEARDQAIKATNAKSMFIANISHEIRTPMNGILATSYLFEDEPLSKTQQEHLRIIQTAAESLLTIINDVLDDSKIESGQFSLVEEDFSLATVLKSVVSLLTPTTDQKGIVLVCSIDPNIPPLLRGDATRLRQIALNLLSNSIKFTGESGAVVLQANCVQKNDISVTLNISVSDTGIGMSSEELDRIFIPYSQANKKVSRTYGGTGLGLSICGKLLALMNSGLQVRSKPRVGSSFSFELELPIARSTEVNAQSEVVEKSQRALSVLVAEDNTTNQYLIRKILNRLGHQCTIVGDGAEALSTAEQQKFDLILMDCSMPKMDGFEAAERIRRGSGKCAQAPIIALTGHAQEAERKRSQKVGMNAFLTKPLDIKALSKILKNLGN